MSFTTPYVTVDGIGNIPTFAEYTSGPVASAYYQALLAFMQVIQTQGSPTSPYPSQNLTSGNVTNVNTALNVLTNVVKYGVLIDNTTGAVTYLSAEPSVADMAGKTRSFVTMGMAQNYDVILRSLAAVGVNTDTSSGGVPQITLEKLQQWLDLALQAPTISRAVQNATLEGFAGAQTLQGMIGTDYIQTGNRLITKNLGDLNSALKITQNVLGILSDIQAMHNQLTVLTSTAAFDYLRATNSPNQSLTQEQYVAEYQRFASGFFGKPISPLPIAGLRSAGDTNFASALSQLIKLRDSLQNQVTLLSGMSTASDLVNSSSLYTRLKTILGDINRTFTTPSGDPVTSATSPADAYAGYRKWMVDNYSAFNSGDVAAQGKIQQNLTFGITAAENLNDTQKSNVRNYMYVFEQYYKSASAALQAITQIIQKMAQNISR